MNITLTNAQSLGADLKSTRDIVRRDIRLRQGYGGQEGLNGDLNRLLMRTLRSSRREEAQTEKSEIKIWSEPRHLGDYHRIL